MKKSIVAILALVVVSAYGQTPEMQVINGAAEALGGKNRILSLKTITIEGYGRLAYQNGGGNITAALDAPQKWINTNGVRRTMDLEHGRMRLEQRLVQDFVFAYARNMTGEVRVNQVSDGDIAFNMGADGRPARAADAVVKARRIEMLNNPVTIMRTALDPATKVSNFRNAGKLQLVDITTAKGIWFLKGQGGNSTLFEFDDHTTLFECYGSEALTKAIIDKARSLVSSKPLTECIVSHHHFDHSGGLRTAVAEGLTIITHRGNVDLFKEMAARPATIFPDALGRNPKPIKIKAVDEHLKLKDGLMEVDIYRVISNSHMADGVFVYVPRDRLVAEGDLVDEGWDISDQCSILNVQFSSEVNIALGGGRAYQILLLCAAGTPFR